MKQQLLILTIVIIANFFQINCSSPQSIPLLPTEFKSNLKYSVNYWLRTEFGDSSASLEQCTVLIVDNNLQQNLTEQIESQITLRINLSGNLTVKFWFNYIQHFSLPCTIAYYNLPTINWLGLLQPSRFMYDLPGQVFNSYHVLIIQGEMLGLGNDSKKTMGYLESKLRTSPLVQQYIGSELDIDDKVSRNLKLMHHLLISNWIQSSPVTINNNNLNSTSDITLSITAFNTWFNESYALGNFTVAGARTKESLIVTARRLPAAIDDTCCEPQDAKPVLLFPDKWHNLNGGYLNVAITPDSSQRQLEEFIRTKIIKTGGYTAAGMYYILQYLNVTPIFATSSANFGQKDPATNKWIGNVGEILDGNVFMASGIGLLHDKLEVITYSQPYHYDKVTFLTALPKETPTPSGSLDFLSRPFHLFVWYSVVGSLVGILTALLVKKFAIDKIQDSANVTASKSASIIFHLLIRPVFDQANHDDSRRRNILADNLSRVLMSIWLLSLIVLITSYKSSSISILLAPTIIYPPKTFLELINSNYRVGSVLYNESFIGRAFSQLDNRVGMEIRSRVKGYSVFKPDCYLEVGKPGNHDVCMSISAFLDLAANKFLTNSNGMKLYKMAEDSLFPIPAACAVPKDFPHLVENMNKIIHRYFDTGLTVQTFKMESGYNAKLGQHYSKDRLKLKASIQVDEISSAWFTNEKSLKQGLNHFVTILLFGFGIAFTLFCLEIIVFYLTTCMNHRSKVFVIHVK